MLSESLAGLGARAEKGNALHLLAVAGVCYALLWVVYTLCFSRLRKVPGPLLARFSRFWELRATLTGRINEVMIDLHKQHGESRAMPGKGTYIH